MKKVLQVTGSGAERRSLVLAADVDSDLPRWLIEIDRALAVSGKGMEKVVAFREILQKYDIVDIGLTVDRP